MVHDAFNRDMGGFEPLPAGDYTCVLVSTEKKATKAGTGHYLNMEFQVIEGEFKGRKKLWTRLNLDNPSHKAVEIAWSELGTIYRAAGITTPPADEWHPNELAGKPILIKVGQRKRYNSDEIENFNKFYDKAGPGTPVIGDGLNPPAHDTPPQHTDDDLPF